MADSGRVRLSRTHINQRCKTLFEHGLLLNLGNDVYNISDNGHAYLTSDLEGETLDEE